MRLIHKKTGETVKRGDIITLNPGKERVMVKGWCMPHKPSSTGRIYVRLEGEMNDEREYFPSVGGCEWIDREDRVGIKEMKVVDRRS